ncbi:MAG: hypothetical protein M3209_00240 [Acidobacteriota bacterium]|nr:hypothetical protein [Acidobacteriota bacterium]
MDTEQAAAEQAKIAEDLEKLNKTETQKDIERLQKLQAEAAAETEEGNGKD